jgi:hypothetical protein
MKMPIGKNCAALGTLVAAGLLVLFLQSTPFLKDFAGAKAELRAMV